jgi:hypothetical protein
MDKSDDVFLRLQKQVSQCDREPGRMSIEAIDDSYGQWIVNKEKLFLSYFKSLPHDIGMNGIDVEKAHAWFLGKFEHQIWNFHLSHWFPRKGTGGFRDALYCLFDDLIIEFAFAGEYMHLYYRTTPLEAVHEIRDEILRSFKLDFGGSPTILLLENTGNGLEVKEMTIDRIESELADNYNDDFQEVSATIMQRLSKPKDKGIVLLHGKPGTGKTSYIRYLIANVKKRVIFLPPNLAEGLTDPSLMSLIVDMADSILVIEDAEKIVIDRDNSQYSAVSALLNLSDGLLSDCLNIQVICSFNTDVNHIDKALMRKGRLIARYEFRELEPDKANRLSAKLGQGRVYDVPVLLTDIYNPEDKEYRQTKATGTIGFKI